jgi:hypothetical protein
MGMRAWVVFLLSLIVIASGCAQLSNPDDPRTQYKDLLEKGQNSEYYVKYSMSMPGLSGITGSNTLANMKVYKKGDRGKTLISSSLGTSSSSRAIYRERNKTIRCTEGSNYLSEDEGITCSLTRNSQDFRQNYKQVEKDYKIEREGSKKVAGRKCNLFKLEMDNVEDLSSIKSDNITSNVCLDNKKGYIAFLTINTTSESAFEDSVSSKKILEMKASDYQGSVDKKSVKPPIDAPVSMSCLIGEPSVEILVLTELENPKLSINGKNKSFSLAKYESREVTLTESEKVDGTNTVKLFTEDSVEKASCTVNGYSYGDTDYSTNYNSSGTDYNNIFTAETNKIDTSNYEKVDRIENNGFSSAEMTENDKADIPGWNYEDGETGHIRTYKGEIDGVSIGTGWKSNGFDDTVSVSQQNVDLTDIDAIAIDAKGDSNAYRSKTVLEIDGENKGYFVKNPQNGELYEDLGIELNQSYSGEHTLTVKWIQIAGDNTGNSIIDNVRTLKE